MAKVRIGSEADRQLNYGHGWKVDVAVLERGGDKQLLREAL